MLRHEAALKVNEALRAAGVAEAVEDEKVKAVVVKIGDRVATLTFDHGTHAALQRKQDVATFRSKLVAQLMGEPEHLLAAPKKSVKG